MTDRSRVLTTTVLGAVAGGLWGWLYLTGSGHRVRRQIEPKLDDFLRELATVRRTIDKARTAAYESRRALDDFTAAGTPGRWPA